MRTLHGLLGITHRFHILEVGTCQLRNLARRQPPLVSYQKHHGVTLTEEGRQRALEVIRHHRLVEAFLHQTLGLPWDRVHAEAERIEHAISEDLEDRIAAHLGYPLVDPHGGPIPAKDGTLPERPTSRLSDLPAGEAAVISWVPDEDPALLRYLAELGLVPGATVTVIDREPFDGPVYLKVGSAGRRPVSPAVCDQVFVISAQVQEISE